METPSETRAINANEVVVKVPSQKPAIERSSTKKRPAKTVKSSMKKTSSLTDEQRRLARNAALREWRKKNAGRVKAYMADWHAKRKGKQPKPVAPQVPTIPAQNRAATAAKGTTRKKSKKEGKA